MIDLDQALENLASPDAAVRADAVRALGARGQAANSGDAIMRLLADDDELVRAEAADALGMLGHVPAASALRVQLRTDRSALVRAAAAESLGDLGQPDAVAELTSALDDEDDAVRAYAANALGLVGGPDLVPVLDLRVAIEPAATVRAELHGARYRLGAPGALTALLAFLDTVDGEVMVNVLNVWDDLTERHRPATLRTDAQQIDAALARVADRLPDLRAHADRLAAQLRG